MHSAQTTSSVVAGKDRANAPSAIVLRCRKGCRDGRGSVTFLGLVMIHDAPSRPRPIHHCPTIRSTRPSGIDRKKRPGQPRKRNEPASSKRGTKNDRTTHRRHGQDGPGSHVVKILWNENDGERELTVRMPAQPGTDATGQPRGRGPPCRREEDPPRRPLDDASRRWRILGNNKYPHRWGRRQKASAPAPLTTVIRINAGASRQRGLRGVARLGSHDIERRVRRDAER